MSKPQAFLLFLILLGAVAVTLRLVSRKAEVVPYQVVLAAAGTEEALARGGLAPPSCI